MGRTSHGCERSGLADTGNSTGGATAKSLRQQEVHRRVRACRSPVREGVCSPGGKTLKEKLWVKINPKILFDGKKKARNSF